MCDAAGGQYIRLASTSSHRLNPFDLPPTDAADAGIDVLAEQVASLLGLLDVMLAEPGRSLDRIERAILDDALYATYERSGITREPPEKLNPLSSGISNLTGVPNTSQLTSGSPTSMPST